MPNQYTTPQGRTRLICQQCGSEFFRWPSEIKKGAGKYCSFACRGLAKRGQRSPNWRGGSYITNRGYRMVHTPDHPSADNKGYVFEHRLVLERTLDRYLEADEVVHHIDGNRLNNDPANLRLMTWADHTGYHASRRPGGRTLKPGQWALWHDCCTICGTTQIEHVARGMCRACYQRIMG